MAQKEYIVYHNRKNLTACAAVMLFGVVAFPLQLIVAARQHQTLYAGVWTTMLLFVAAAEIISTYGLIKMLYLLAIKPPALIIDQEGILDKMNILTASGRIRWSDIAQFEVKGNGTSQALHITLYDREALLRSKPLFTRVCMRMFKPDVGGGAFKIETRRLATTADTLRAEMRRYRPDLCI